MAMPGLRSSCFSTKNSQDVQSDLVPAKSSPTALTLFHTSPCFYVSAVQVFRKHREKRRNCS